MTKIFSEMETFELVPHDPDPHDRFICISTVGTFEFYTVSALSSGFEYP